MDKRMICIECPKGCELVAEFDKGYLIKLTGNKCPKGEAYAKQEIENPSRTLTSTVLTDGLGIKMLPVKTSRPIPKDKLLSAMEEIKKLRLIKPIKIGEVIVQNFMGLGVDLLAARNYSPSQAFERPALKNS